MLSLSLLVRLAVLGCLVAPSWSFSTGFHPQSSLGRLQERQRQVQSRLFLSQPLSSLTFLMTDIDQAVTDTTSDETTILARIQALEQAPDAPLVDLSVVNQFGYYEVLWTNAPPPSNGQLGPFKGSAAQAIGTEGLYQNVLRVGDNNWLGATLDGRWEEWDGVLLDGSGTTSTPTTACWKVTFMTLKIQALDGKLTLFEKQFPSNNSASRIWRTTYLDENIRVVRAGKTGRPEDEVVFYTKRRSR